MCTVVGVFIFLFSPHGGGHFVIGNRFWVCTVYRVLLLCRLVLRGNRLVIAQQPIA